MSTLSTNKVHKSSEKYICELCDYTTSRQCQYNRHLDTEKHKKRIMSTNINDLVQKSSLSYKCEVCNKTYKERTGLWKHKKKCIYNNEINQIIYDKNNKSNQIINSDLKDTYSNTDNENNVKSLSNLVLELIKSNTDLQKQMLEVCKNSNNIINSNNNNKTFNMQVFLNEKCKDAMNLTDFVNSMTLQFSDLEELGELGYVEGISRQMVRKLNEMDIYKRPIHCSDLKRETMYVRDNNVWEKETEIYDKLRKAIKYITKKNGDLMIPWRDAHPQCMKLEHPLNDIYLGIMNQAMGGKGEFAESESKIIRKISKSVTIDKSDF
jgi:hypothetical protein